MANPIFAEPGTDATQDFSLWSGTTGTCTSSTAQFHSGSRSIELLTTTLAAINRHTVLADVGRRISFWVRFDTVPSSDAQIVSLASSGGAADILLFFITSAGKIKNGPVGATAVTGTTVLSVNTWYQICICYTITNTTTYACKVYINGILDSTTNAGTLTGIGTADIYLVGDTPFGSGKKIWFDDIHIDDGTDNLFPGIINVTYKRPFANGIAVNFTTQIGSGGSGYGTGHAPQVNEQPLSQTNGWSMIGAGSQVIEEYNIEGLTVGDVNLTGKTIVGVFGWLFAKSLASEVASIIVDGTFSNISLTSTAISFVQPSATPTIFPTGTGTDIGIRTTTALTTVSLYEGGIIISYINPVSAVKSLALLGVG